MSAKKKTSQTRINKNKALLGEKEVLDMLIKGNPVLTLADIKAREMGQAGSDVFLLSPLAKEVLSDRIEVKRRKGRASFYSYLEQARAWEGKGTPQVFFRSDRHEWVVLMYAKDYLGVA